MKKMEVEDEDDWRWRWTRRSGEEVQREEETLKKLFGSVPALVYSVPTNGIRFQLVEDVEVEAIFDSMWRDSVPWPWELLQHLVFGYKVGCNRIHCFILDSNARDLHFVGFLTCFFGFACERRTARCWKEKV